MSSSPCTSKKSSLENLKSIKPSEAGQTYENLSFALLARHGYELSKANSKFRNFSVGRDVDLGKDWKFGDILFSYIDEYDTKNLILIEIKHKLQDDFRIDSQILSAEATRVKSGMQRQFNLQKYFISYLSVREELKHTEEIAEELRNGKIKYIAIFTNMALDTEDLNSNGFRLKEAPYDIINLLSLNNSISMTEDFDPCYQLSEISEGLRKIFKKSSDLHRLARELAQYVVWKNYRENLIMGIDKTPIKYYHVALEREVIQKSYQVEIKSPEKQMKNKRYCEVQFRDDFVENDEPGPTQTLRDAIFEAIREMDESKKDVSDDELKSILKDVKWKSALNFGKPNPNIKKKLPWEWMTVTEEDITDFLKCLVFIVNQPRVAKLQALFQATVTYDAALRQIMQKKKDVVNVDALINKDEVNVDALINKDEVNVDVLFNKDAVNVDAAINKDAVNVDSIINKDAVNADAVINKDAAVQRKFSKKVSQKKFKGNWTTGPAITELLVLYFQYVKFSEPQNLTLTNLATAKFSEPQNLTLTNLATPKFSEPQNLTLTNLATAVTLLYESEINRYGTFSKLGNARETLNKFLLSNNQILCITTSVILLSSIKMLQSLDGLCNYRAKDGRISVNFDILKCKIIREDIVKSFKLGRNNLLTIECRHSIDEHDIEEFYYKLSKVVRNNPTKKIILIVQQEVHNILSEKFKKDFQNNGQFILKSDVIDLNDFVPMEDPLKKKLIIFQGQKQRVSLAELIGIESWDSYSQGIFLRYQEIIDVTTLITILNDDEIEIGSKPLGTSNLSGAYATLCEEVNTETLANKLLSKELIDNIEEMYIMSRINGSSKQEKIEKLIKCLGLTSKEEIIEEQLGDIGSDSKIQIADDQFEDEAFKAICHKHPEKEVFWIYNEEQQKFILQKFYNPTFYLKRKFKNVIIKNVIIKNEIKELLMDDNLAEIFIFSPVNDVENFYVSLGLTDEKEKRNVENNYKHSKNPTIKIFTSEDAAVTAFEELCRVNQTVHRLKFEENKLVWCDSHGSVNNLRKYIDDKESEISLVEENNLIKEIKNKKMVIIADGPGTGKTTTIIKLYESKHESRSFIETHWVVNLNLMNNIQAIKDVEFLDGCIDIVSVVNFLSKVDVKLNNNLAKCLLRTALDKNKNFSKPFLLVLDGFDEVLDEFNRDKLIALLKFLRNDTTAKLWITTRLHYKDTLEKELSSFAVQFNPIDPDTQFTYIKMYLRDRSCLILDKEKINKVFSVSSKMPVNTVIQKFLEAFLNKSIFSFKTNEPDVIRTPLELRLMLEGSVRHLKYWIENINDEYKSNYLGKDAWEVHKNFVSRIYEVYFKKINIREHERQREEKFLLNMYCKELAIVLIFKLEPKSTLKAFQDKALSAGIITSHGSNIEFIHTSCRDYFASKVFIHWMKEKPNKLSSTNKQEYILKEVLKRPDFQLIRSFIDIKLKKMAKSDLLDDITQQYGEIIEKLIKDEQSAFDEGETVLHIAVKERNLYIASFLLNVLKRHKHVLKKFLFACNERKETTLHLACNKEFSKLVKILLDAVAGISEDIKEHRTYLNEFLFMCDENGETALHLACREGTEEIVRILLEAAEGISKEHKTCLKEFLFMCDKSGKTALHFACREGTGEVVRILLEAAAGISEDTKEHKACLEKFLFMCDENWETALHLACREGTGKVVRILLEAAGGISEDTQKNKSVLKQFIFMHNIFSKTALHYAYGGVIDDAVEISEVTLFSLCLKSLNRNIS